MAKELPTPTLQTARFTMRKLVREDTAALFPTLCDPDQCRYLTRPHFESEAELEGWLFEPGWEGRSWGAVEKSTGELVARLVAVPAGKATWEIGYTTVSHRQGVGIAAECAERLVQFLFEDEDNHRVTAGTDPRNIASNHLLEKLGFRREAHYVEAVETHIGWCDEYYWGMLAREWRAAKGT